jgi:glutathione S-transferase
MLEIPFVEQLHPFPEDKVWEMYRRFSPSGKVPCLQDDSTTLWESVAIAEHLAEAHPGVWPQEKQARSWARCASAEMHSGFQTLRSVCSMNCGVRIELPEISSALQKDLNRIDELWCEGLTKFGGPFLAGANFTAVDAFYAPIAFRAQTYGLQLSYKAMGYIQRLLALPPMINWYNSALIEVWREPAHEQDPLKFGQLIADFRRSKEPA